VPGGDVFEVAGSCIDDEDRHGRDVVVVKVVEHRFGAVADLRQVVDVEAYERVDRGAHPGHPRSGLDAMTANVTDDDRGHSPRVDLANRAEARRGATIAAPPVRGCRRMPQLNTHHPVEVGHGGSQSAQHVASGAFDTGCEMGAR
jgi:hypothetical protein